MEVEIPDKLYFKIGEVSKLARVAPHVLRYWESEFKEIQPKRANSNQRLYRRDDVKVVLLIKNSSSRAGLYVIWSKKVSCREKTECNSSVTSGDGSSWINKTRTLIRQKTLKKKEVGWNHFLSSTY